MKQLLHVASGAPVQVGHCIFDRRSGEKRIICHIPEPHYCHYVGYRDANGKYWEIPLKDAGLYWDKPWCETLYHNSSVEYGGLRFRVKFENDTDSGAPWEECDGHGIVSEKTDRAKRPGEVEIGNKEHGRRYLYDWQGTIAVAKAEGWGAPPYGVGTKGEQAVRAVKADYKFLDAWLKDEWNYVFVDVTCYDLDGNELCEDSCGGVETWKDYHMEHAWDMIEELADQHQRALELARLQAEADRVAREAEQAELQAIANQVRAILRTALSFAEDDPKYTELMSGYRKLCAKAGVRVE